jgi:CheY-like chemotaxis protein
LKKLLIIENDIDTLDMVAFISEGVDFEVIKSVTTLSVKEVADLNPNIIIIDYRLDDGFGDEFCSVLKTDDLTKHIPVVLYSASKNLEIMAQKSGATAFLEKPFDLVQLEQILSEFSL